MAEPQNEKEMYRAKIDELRQHMEEEGETFDMDAVDEDDIVEASESMKVKLTWKPGAHMMFAVPSDQDWAHDMIGDIQVIPGTLYASGEPFIEGTTQLTGYFQSDETGEWIFVDCGAVVTNASTGALDWKADLMDFPELVDQFEACMEVSEYRHMAEKAAMTAMVSGNL